MASSPESSEKAGAVSWTVHPARSRPGAAAGAVGVIALFSVIVAQQGGSAGWGVFAAVFLILVLNRFFFASRYEIDASGLTARYPLGTKRLAWGEVRRFAFGAGGATFSSRARSSVWETRSTVHVVFDENPGRIEAAIRSFLPADGAVEAGRDGTRRGAA